MKITCDLCGGTLQMNAGAQDASCKTCGLCYPLDMLRQKLGTAGVQQQNEVQTPINPVPPVEQPVVTPVVQPTPAAQPVQPLRPIVSQPEQFIMKVDSFANGCLNGYVQQGCIGVGEQVYLNGDYSKAYRMYCFGNDSALTHVEAGKHACMYLAPNNKSALRQAHTVTGDRVPVANAYRFNGSVKEYFADLLQRKFAQYAQQKQVAWPELDIPVDFMLFENGRPVAAILVFDSHDAHSRYQAKKAEDIFGAAMIGFTYFYEDYRNDELYVAERIRTALGC